MKKRVYVDTSVFGGIFDKEFKNASSVFFDQVRKGKFIIVTSPVVIDEISLAPIEVRKLYKQLNHFIEVIEISNGALELRDAYLNAKIVSKKYSNDALHVAFATISECLIIVSWNFKHIVNFEKIPLYNAINIINGYKQVAIHSPLEVINYG
ncbi:MAG: type II toxin-antitoxin system VapC family toxin [Bacteroidetes bacterium]|nr:type II toxin-antitoxin system VapC family toxin [Bacteroidota bacterium]